MAKPKILVVDDEKLNRSLLEAMLIPLGYNVSLAKSGEEALEKVNEVLPDVILLDIMMPNMDGYEVARRLKDDDDAKLIPRSRVLISIANARHRLELRKSNLAYRERMEVMAKARTLSLKKLSIGGTP